MFVIIGHGSERLGGLDFNGLHFARAGEETVTSVFPKTAGFLG